jgi:hypothetical protein
MFFGLTSPWQVRVRLRGGVQIGLEPDSVERRLVGEARCNRWITSGCGVKASSSLPDDGGEHGVDAAVAQLILPDGVRGPVEEVHGEQPRRAILAAHHRDRLRRDGGGGPQPRNLGGVALDGNLPPRRDLQPGQGALDADRRAVDLDAENIGRHAAGQRREDGPLAIGDQAHAGEGGVEIVACGRHGRQRLATMNRRRNGNSVRPSASGG